MLFRWLMSVANKASKNAGDAERRSTSTPPPIPRTPAESEEERIRKFLEALGQPAGSRPPPPVTTQRPTYQKPVVLPHVPPFGSPLPPLTTRPPELPRTVAPAPTKKTASPKSIEAKVEVREIAPPSAPSKSIEPYALAAQPTSEAVRKETNIVSLLRSSSGLRNAIILREIFGPPRSLSEPDWRL